jgi:single-strand DNA-binding protein
MAQSLNKQLLIGNVGAEPRVSQFQDKKVAQFTVATSESYKDRSGNQVKNTDWHDVVAWSPLAEIVEQYVKRGSRVYVEGRTRRREYDTADGEKRRVVEVVAQTIVLLDSKPQNGDNGGRYAPAPQPQYQSAAPARPQPAPAAAPAYAPQYEQQSLQGDFGDGLGIGGDDDMPAF